MYFQGYLATNIFKSVIKIKCPVKRCFGVTCVSKCTIPLAVFFFTDNRRVYSGERVNKLLNTPQALIYTQKKSNKPVRTACNQHSCMYKIHTFNIFPNIRGTLEQHTACNLQTSPPLPSPSDTQPRVTQLQFMSTASQRTRPHPQHTTTILFNHKSC